MLSKKGLRSRRTVIPGFAAGTGR
jgi:hypothetical protein